MLNPSYMKEKLRENSSWQP